MFGKMLAKYKLTKTFTKHLKIKKGGVNLFLFFLKAQKKTIVIIVTSKYYFVSFINFILIKKITL